MKLHKKRSDKVAICGFSPTSRDLAPYDDQEWEIWGCNDLYNYVPRLNVLFELHNREWYGEYFGNPTGKDHVEWQKKCGIPIYHAKKYDDIPTSIAYPWDVIFKAFPYGDYLTNTISEMLALAIYMGYKKIGIWGVDMAHHTEFDTQKPSVEYFLGIAAGLYKAQGYPEIFIPAECDLLKSMYIYGRDDEKGLKITLKQKSQYYERKRIEQANIEIQARDQKNIHQGRVMMIQELLKLRMP